MNEHEAAQRSEPKAGEYWYFSNGKTGRIMEPDPKSDYPYPEIAMVPGDYSGDEMPDGWKFNGPHDPLPIRKVDPPEMPVERYGYPVAITVTIPLLESEYNRLRTEADGHTNPTTVMGHIRERLGFNSLPIPHPDRLTKKVVSEHQYLEDFPYPEV